MTTTNLLPDSAGYLGRFRARVLQDALNEATAAYWLRRAEAFENARTRPGSPPATGDSPEAVDDRRRAATALACRNRAAYAQMYPEELAGLIREALAETRQHCPTCRIPLEIPNMKSTGTTDTRSAA